MSKNTKDELMEHLDYLLGDRFRPDNCPKCKQIQEAITLYTCSPSPDELIAEIERLKGERQSSIDATNFWANEHRKLLDKYHILESGLASQPTAQQILDHSKPIQIPEQMREKIAKRS